jgi:hypothetical protein
MHGERLGCGAKPELLSLLNSKQDFVDILRIYYFVLKALVIKSVVHVGL